MELTSICQHVDFADVMTTGEVARLLRRSLPTIRALAERSWHPLPCINTGNGNRKQRLFLRSAVLRWIEEELEQTRQPITEGADRTAKSA